MGKTKRKSQEAYDSGKISLELHVTHETNLAPTIKIFTEAVEILKKEMV